MRDPEAPSAAHDAEARAGAGRGTSRILGAVRLALLAGAALAVVSLLGALVPALVPPSPLTALPGAAYEALRAGVFHGLEALVGLLPLPFPDLSVPVRDGIAAGVLAAGALEVDRLRHRARTGLRDVAAALALGPHRVRSARETLYGSARPRAWRGALAVAGLMGLGTGAWLLLADPSFLPGELAGGEALSFRLRLGACIVLGAGAFVLARLMEEAAEAADAESVQGAARGTRRVLAALAVAGLVALVVRGFAADLLGAGLVLLGAIGAGVLAGLLAFAAFGLALALVRGWRTLALGSAFATLLLVANAVAAAL